MKSINYLLSAQHQSPPLGIVNVDWLAFSVHLLETAKERNALFFILLLILVNIVLVNINEQGNTAKELPLVQILRMAR